MMNLPLDNQELLALGFFVFCWFSYAGYSEHQSRKRHSLVTATSHWRMQWMREMLGRENRSVDAITVGNITRSFTFFASTTMFILAALVSLLALHDQVNTVIHEVPFAKLNAPGVWQIKIGLLIIIFTYGFFKFTWSMRQYNYVSIFIAAMPDYRVKPDNLEELAERGAALTGNAGRHFNNGLRAYYFGLAVLGWFIHPYLFMLATALVVLVTYRREYRSSTLKHLSA